MDGLIRLRRPEQVAELRGLTVAQVLGIQKTNGTSETITDEGLDAKPAGPVAAGDPPPPPVAKASSGAVPPTAPPAGEADAAKADDAPAADAKADETPVAEEPKAEESS